MIERCHNCDRPKPTEGDHEALQRHYDTEGEPPDGAFAHLCWDSETCHPHDWRAECLRLREELEGAQMDAARLRIDLKANKDVSAALAKRAADADEERDKARRRAAQLGACGMGHLDADHDRWAPPHGPKIWACIEWGPDVADHLYPERKIDNG